MVLLTVTAKGDDRFVDQDVLPTYRKRQNCVCSLDSLSQGGMSTQAEVAPFIKDLNVGDYMNVDSSRKDDLSLSRPNNSMQGFGRHGSSDGSKESSKPRSSKQKITYR